MAPDKNGKRSLKAKAFILLTVVMVILSVAAVVISINITSIMLGKYDQLAAGKPDAAVSLKKAGSGASSLVNLKKAERLPLYFNGTSREGMLFYMSENDQSLLPFDMILDDLGAKYGIMNSDDAFTTAVNGKNIVLDLGTEAAKLGDVPVKFDTASMAAEGHILAPAGILGFLDGFAFNGDTVGGAAFTYYWPSVLDNKYSVIRLFRLNGRRLEVSGMSGDKPFTYEASGPGLIDAAVPSKSIGGLLIRSAGGYYAVSDKNYKKPVKLDIQGYWRISPGGGFLYRLDETAKVWLIYDVKSSSVKKIKDIYSGLSLKNGASLADRRMFGYEIGKSFTRVDFEGLDGEVNTVVSRSGKMVVWGASRYSPDYKRLLLYDRSNGWSMADYDGRNVVRFKDVSSADWIDNDRVLLKTAAGFAVYDRKDKAGHTAAGSLDYVGKGDDGRIFFTKGEDLYQTTGGIEKKIAGLPWECDFAVSKTSKGAVIGISEEADLIFALSGKNILTFGTPGLFPNSPAVEDEDGGFGRNASFSADGGRLAVLQRGEKFLEVVLLDLKEMKQEKLTLDYSPNAFADKPVIKVKWLGNTSLAVYVSGQAWIIDGGGGKTYIRELPGETPIAGIFQLPQ